jgi:hypothetical protein
MNHEEAITNQVAASYLLGDLSAAERDAFEEHYFDCRVCAEDVRAGAAMFAAGREVAANAPEVRRFRPLKWAASGAAAAALTIVVGYQSVIIPRVQSLAAPPVMEVLNPMPLVAAGATRGEASDEEVISFKRNETYVLYRDIPDEPRFPSYEIELRKAAGKVLTRSQISPELTSKLLIKGDPIPIQVRALPAGRYVLAIRGVREDGNRPELVSYSVVVK